MEVLNCHRMYFVVTDDAGNEHPAVEYVAATHDDGCLKRFVKLIGSGEHLEALEGGRFVGSRSRRTFRRASSAVRIGDALHPC